MKKIQYFLCFIALTAIIACQSDNSPNDVKNEPFPTEKITEETPSTTLENSTSTTGINTAASAAYMSAREKEMIKEINLIRSNPQAYVPIVEAFRGKLKEMNFVDPNQINLEMEAVNSLVSELKVLQPLSILQPRSTLHESAKKHGLELKQYNRTGHNGMDGSWPWDRIGRDDPQAGASGENLVGGVPGVRDAVLTLLVDTGIPGYGHRKNLLDKRWEYVACYEVDKIKDLESYWVQNFMALK